ncbi:MAG: hypothetical protein JSR75_06520 [Proteobacteria bacterium]|nr:hypothetical protein [Pseudomonadota bacterium]
MNSNTTAPMLIAAVALGSALATGCASIAVTDEAIVERTAFALGLAKGDFSISSRVDDGTTARYSVRTKAGQDYNCFVGGSISVTGRTVSEAICSKKGEVARNPLLR